MLSLANIHVFHNLQRKFGSHINISYGMFIVIKPGCQVKPRNKYNIAMFIFIVILRLGCNVRNLWIHIKSKLMKKQIQRRERFVHLDNSTNATQKLYECF